MILELADFCSRILMRTGNFISKLFRTKVSTEGYQKKERNKNDEQ